MFPDRIEYQLFALGDSRVRFEGRRRQLVVGTGSHESVLKFRVDSVRLSDFGDAATTLKKEPAQRIKKAVSADTALIRAYLLLVVN